MDASSMRAAVARGPQKVGVEPLERPQPGPGEARVRIRACGICGTDLHFHQLGLYAPGLVPGHEMAGEIEAVGPEVDDLETGAPVAVEPLLSCGRCPSCASGRHSICPEVRVLGLHVNGGLCESVVVPRERLFRAADDLDPRVASLAEPTAVGLHGLDRGGFRPGQRVLILGAGAIGLLTLLAARRAGAGEVWITARHPHQVERARAFGATEVVTGDETRTEALEALGRSTPMDLVVEAVGGGADTVKTAVAAARPGGTVSVLGVFLGPLALDPFPLLLKEVNLAWSNCYAHAPGGADFDRALALLAEEREAAAELLTHQAALEDIDRAYATAADKTAGTVKVTVIP